MVPNGSMAWEANMMRSYDVGNGHGTAVMKEQQWQAPSTPAKVTSDMEAAAALRRKRRRCLWLSLLVALVALPTIAVSLALANRQRKEPTQVVTRL